MRGVYIDSTSIVLTKDIGKGTYIGPYCYIPQRVSIGKNCRMVGFASIGTPGEHPHDPEDMGGVVRVEDEVEIREFVTINAPIFGAETVIGFHSYLMTKSHVGHDVCLGDHNVLSSGSVIGGHTVSGKYCYFGLTAVTHQRAKIGNFCMIGANSFFKGDSPDGIIWAGVPAKPIKINIVGLDRHASLKEKEIVISDAKLFLQNKNIVSDI